MPDPMPVNNPVVQERLRRLEQLPQFQSLPPEVQRRYREEAERRWMAEVRPPEAPSATRAPERGPGLLGWPFEVAGRLDVAQGLKTPEEARRRAREYGEILGETALWSALPSKLTATLLRRLGLGAGLEALRALTQRKTGQETMRDVAIRTLTQLPFEAIPAAGRGLEHLRGSRIVGEAARMYRQAREAYEAWRSQHATMAKQIADEVKDLVPSFRDLPSSAKGLWSMAFMDGPRRLMKTYGDMLQRVREAIPPDHQTLVPLRLALGRAKGVKPDALAAVNPDAMVPVNTREVIERWIPTTEDVGARLQLADRVAASLEDVAQGLGQEYRRVRQEYWYGRGVQTFFERARKAFKRGGEELDPEALLNALTDPRGARALRTREIEHIVEPARGGPGRPPARRPSPESLGVEVQEVPWLVRHAITSPLVYGGARGLHALGVPPGLDYLLALGPYAAAAQMLPRYLYRKPLDPAVIEWLRRAPLMGGTVAVPGVRRLVEPSPESTPPAGRP